MLTYITLFGALLPFVHAVGNAKIFNNCADPVYVWSVDSSVESAVTVESGYVYSEQYRYDDQTGGITLKVTAVADGIYNSAPELDYAYTLNSATVWYDISDVNGDPFANHTVALVPVDSSCESFTWADGTSPSGIHTSSCGSDGDVQLTLCQ